MQSTIIITDYWRLCRALLLLLGTGACAEHSCMTGYWRALLLLLGTGDLCGTLGERRGQHLRDHDHERGSKTAMEMSRGYMGYMGVYGRIHYQTISLILITDYRILQQKLPRTTLGTGLARTGTNTGTSRYTGTNTGRSRTRSVHRFVSTH